MNYLASVAMTHTQKASINYEFQSFFESLQTSLHTSSGNTQHHHFYDKYQSGL